MGCALFVGHVNGRAVVRIVGVLDTAGAARLKEALESLDDPIEIDCRGLELVDGSGLGTLVRMAEAREITLRHPSPALLHLIKAAGVDGLLRTR